MGLHTIKSGILLAALVFLSGCASTPPQTPAAPLQIEVYTGRPNAFGVVSTIIYGEREAILVDAQFYNSDAEPLADRIAALGRRLTAIVITHPDADHFVGMGLLHERFPEARIYMTQRGIDGFRESVDGVLARIHASRRPEEAPAREPDPELLTSSTLYVDGQPVELITDMQGDYMKAEANSVLWIPSLRALIASDMAFDGVHLWLDESTPETRAAWRAALQQLQAMQPAIVVPGHRGPGPIVDTSPSVLTETSAYIETFERHRAASADAAALTAAMQASYPDYAYPLFLQIAARSAYATHEPSAG